MKNRIRFRPLGELPTPPLVTIEDRPIVTLDRHGFVVNLRYGPYRRDPSAPPLNSKRRK